MTERRGRSRLALLPEERLLVVVAGSSSSGNRSVPELSEHVRSILEERIDWDRYLKLARHQLCLAATYRLFKDLGLLTEMSERARRASQHGYMLSHARLMKKEAELQDILSAFASSGVEAIVLKGIPLSYLLYDDPGVRASMDIDILVPPSRVDEAKRIMMEKGYSLYTALRSVRDYEKHHFHYVFSRGDNLDSIVEIHWDIVYPDMVHFVADPNELFERAISVDTSCARMRTLGLPHAFWHMAVHVSYKSFLGFRNFVDLKRIAGRLDGEGWRYVAAWSRRCDTDIELRCAVDLAESLFGRLSDVPGGLQSYFPVRTRIPRLFHPRALVRGWTPFLGTHMLAVELLLRKGIAGKLRCLYHFVFPDRHIALKFNLSWIREKKFGGIRMPINGMYVVLKVLALICFAPVIIRSGVFGTAFRDLESRAQSDSTS